MANSLDRTDAFSECQMKCSSSGVHKQRRMTSKQIATKSRLQTHKTFCMHLYVCAHLSIGTTVFRYVFSVPRPRDVCFSLGHEKQTTFIAMALPRSQVYADGACVCRAHGRGGTGRLHTNTHKNVDVGWLSHKVG